MAEFVNEQLLYEAAELFSHQAFDIVSDPVVITDTAALVIRYGEIFDRPSAQSDGSPSGGVGDIDIATTLENCLKLEQHLGFIAVRKVVGQTAQGDERSIVVRHDEQARFDVHRWHFSFPRYEVTKRLQGTGNGRIYLEEMVSRSTLHKGTGIYVATETLVEETKRTGRKKDAQTLARLGQFHRDGY